MRRYKQANGLTKEINIGLDIGLKANEDAGDSRNVTGLNDRNIMGLSADREGGSRDKGAEGEGGEGGDLGEGEHGY